MHPIIRFPMVTSHYWKSLQVDATHFLPQYCFEHDEKKNGNDREQIICCFWFDDFEFVQPISIRVSSQFNEKNAAQKAWLEDMVIKRKNQSIYKYIFQKIAAVACERQHTPFAQAMKLIAQIVVTDNNSIRTVNDVTPDAPPSLSCDGKVEDGGKTGDCVDVFALKVQRSSVWTMQPKPRVIFRFTEAYRKFKCSKNQFPYSIFFVLFFFSASVAFFIYVQSVVSSAWLSFCCFIIISLVDVFPSFSPEIDKVQFCKVTPIWFMRSCIGFSGSKKCMKEPYKYSQEYAYWNIYKPIYAIVFCKVLITSIHLHPLAVVFRFTSFLQLPWNRHFLKCFYWTFARNHFELLRFFMFNLQWILCTHRFLYAMGHDLWELDFTSLCYVN